MPVPRNDAAYERQYEDARLLAVAGEHVRARVLYERLIPTAAKSQVEALIHSDLAAIAAVEGLLDQARNGFQAALHLDQSCEPARANLALLQENLECEWPRADPPDVRAPTDNEPNEKIKVAVLSFLFNWPSTGGGIIHTVELAQFLSRAGYDVRHFYAQYPPWGIGGVPGSLPFASETLAFDEANWNVPSIQARFRQAVEAFDPDYVIITDSWNFKPLLAEAVRGYPYILRQQALECLCPLNNIRLLVEEGDRVRQCPFHQLARPDECSRCLSTRGQNSGALHQAERTLSGVGTPEYLERLRRALWEAEAVLVLNPMIEATLSPYARNVRVVTWGMDPARFPWPPPGSSRPTGGKVTIFMAGLVQEMIKGFHILHAACAKLWARRQDFELVATGEPAGQVDAFTRFTGWLSQEELPQHLWACDILVMPTIAQEGLGRTTVEAMAAGRPVIASRIGGLPYTVLDEATGLLCEPGDADDLAAKIERLLDDPALREHMGLLGRKRFEEHFTWDGVIERHYKPLLTKRQKAPRP